MKKKKTFIVWLKMNLYRDSVWLQQKSKDVITRKEWAACDTYIQKWANCTLTWTILCDNRERGGGILEIRRNLFALRIDIIRFILCIVCVWCLRVNVIYSIFTSIFLSELDKCIALIIQQSISIISKPTKSISICK